MSDDAVNPLDCGARIFLCRECVKCLTIRLERAEGKIEEDKTTRWYVYDPEHGLETHDTEEAARDDAEQLLEEYRDRSPDGWHEDMAALQWGRLVPYQWACEVDRREAPEGSEHDYLCDYQLVTVR
jgi:hypothetical protein